MKFGGQALLLLGGGHFFDPGSLRQHHDRRSVGLQSYRVELRVVTDLLGGFSALDDELTHASIFSTIA
jgi:hypothetical protein